MVCCSIGTNTVGLTITLQSPRKVSGKTGKQCGCFPINRFTQSILEVRKMYISKGTWNVELLGDFTLEMIGSTKSNKIIPSCWMRASRSVKVPRVFCGRLHEILVANAHWALELRILLS